MKLYYKDTESVISFGDVKFVVFWSKNPKPLIQHLKTFTFDYYFQFTLNNYPEYELNVPELNERINTFIELSETIGKERVIWRFDPIIVNNAISKDLVIERIKGIGDQLYKHTNKLVFSFIDPYYKLKGEFNEIDNDAKISLAESIVELNKNWNISLSTCAESINLSGIEHNKCVDPDLIKLISGDQKWVKDTKDANQRLFCGCVKSTDIGTFGICKHNCIYCYAK